MTQTRTIEKGWRCDRCFKLDDCVAIDSPDARIMLLCRDCAEQAGEEWPGSGRSGPLQSGGEDPGP